MHRYCFQCLDKNQNNIILNIVLAGLQLVAVCLAKNYYIYILLSGIISIINKIALVKSINKTKQDVQSIDDVEDYIEQEVEY